MTNTIEAFISRWESSSGGAERANYGMFFSELCDVLQVPRPEPASGGGGDYRFERSVVRHELDGSTSTRRIDLYKRDCFIVEAKQASSSPRQANLFGLVGQSEAERRALVRRTPGWTKHMLGGKGQALDYARDIAAAGEGWPPFLLVCDVGFCLDVHADFSRNGRHYTQFPDRDRHRVYLTDLRQPAIRERLRAIWLDPMSLDPQRQRVLVTREVSQFLARLAQALEARGHTPERVSSFLMRALFSMFAQSSGLLPSGTAFTDLLVDCRANLAQFVPLLGDLWRVMDKGGFSGVLRADLRHFNGGLFDGAGPHGAIEPIAVTADELDLLISASRRDWSAVEPSIFGTLLENAISSAQRGQFGAHFTPRAFVEPLVQAVVMDPLLEEWNGVKAAAVMKEGSGDRPGAALLLRAFHHRLCTLSVLDPACGSANFLYVAFDMMKRLEGEVLDVLADVTEGVADRLDLVAEMVDPRQFHGIDLNARAVPVAELVLWLGFLQWHFRSRPGHPVPQPILRNYQNIQWGDALLRSSGAEMVPGVSRWGGRMTLHAITGEAVPDETDRVPMLRPKAPKPATWPKADFIVGNPPFIAGKDLRAELGDGYAEALWGAYPKVGRSADLAMFFWWKASQLVASGKAIRFGFITSNSLRQVFCRRVVEAALVGRKALHLVYAVPDHPWTDGSGSAAVRIALTACAAGAGEGVLRRVVEERRAADGVPEVVFAEARGRINADLSVGTDVKQARPLRANERIASRGMALHGSGFIVTPQEAAGLGLGRVPGLEAHIRPYRNGRDVQQHPRGVMVIDLFGLSEVEVRRRFPSVYQHVLTRVKPERDQNNRSSYRENWWVFGEPRGDLRPALKGLSRYVATVETAKHRVFTFLPAEVLPDNMLIAIGSDDAFHLGVLSSRVHVAFALETGGTLEDRPRYNKTQCFDPFPFPFPPPNKRAEIAAIAEELDALRKARLAAHPQLTLTALYNVLAVVRAGLVLSDAERDILDAGHVLILRRLHDDLDAAVAAAYGWPAALSDADIVARIVALNAERSAEEAQGQVRWLRPAYQAPEEAVRAAAQSVLDVDEGAALGVLRWPAQEPAQFVALRAVLRHGPLGPREVAREMMGAPRGDRLVRMLSTLEALGQIRRLEDGRYSA